MIDVDNLSSRELATCVDEFVRRAMSTLTNNGYSGPHGISIVASRYGSDDKKYDIVHTARIGSEYGGGISRQTNNLVLSATRTNAAWAEDQNDKPTEVRPMIEHQPEPETPVVEVEEEHEEAIYEEIAREAGSVEENDDVPF